VNYGVQLDSFLPISFVRRYCRANLVFVLTARRQLLLRVSPWRVFKDRQKPKQTAAPAHAILVCKVFKTGAESVELSVGRAHVCVCDV